MSPLSAIPATALAPAEDRVALRRATEGFEAMLVRRMLAAARGDAGPGDAFSGMFDGALADLAAARGAFGIAAALEAQLAGSSVRAVEERR